MIVSVHKLCILFSFDFINDETVSSNKLRAGFTNVGPWLTLPFSVTFHCLAIPFCECSCKKEIWTSTTSTCTSGFADLWHRFMESWTGSSWIAEERCSDGQCRKMPRSRKKLLFRMWDPKFVGPFSAKESGHCWIWRWINRYCYCWPWHVLDLHVACHVSWCYCRDWPIQSRVTFDCRLVSLWPFRCLVISSSIYISLILNQVC